MGNVPLGYLPNIENQFLTLQPGLVQSDFPPLSSPFLPQQTAIPNRLLSQQNPNSLINPSHLQYDTTYAPNSKNDSDIDHHTDTNDLDNGKEKTEENKGTQNEYRHG
jgi:hypothetical protein